MLVFFLSNLIHPGRPFDLAVFEDSLWISDREHQQLRSVHKRTGKKLQRIHGNMVQPASIVVVHPLAKPGIEIQQGFILEINLFRSFPLRFKNTTCSNSSTSNIKRKDYKMNQDHSERLRIMKYILLPPLPVFILPRVFNKLCNNTD